jgi:hypothetical protein
MPSCGDFIGAGETLQKTKQSKTRKPFAQAMVSVEKPWREEDDENSANSSGFADVSAFRVDTWFQSIQQWNNQWICRRRVRRRNTRRHSHGNKQRDWRYDHSPE